MRRLAGFLLSMVLTSAGWGQTANLCNCGEPSRDAVAGVYQVKGTYRLASRGKDVEEHLMQGVFSGTVRVPDLGPGRGSGPIQPGPPHGVTMQGLASVETFAGGASRPESFTGHLEGYLSLKPALLYLKGEDMTFRISIEKVDCTQVSGVVVVDEETPLDLSDSVEAEGLTVIHHSGTFEATLDRDTSKLALAADMERRCAAADHTNDHQTRSTVRSALALAKSFDDKDPFERCLMARVHNAAACLLASHAEWMVDEFTRKGRAFGDLAQEGRQLARVMGAMHAAEALGCVLISDLKTLADYLAAQGLDAAKKGASAADLAKLYATAHSLGFEATAEGMTVALNAAARAGGQPIPFP